MNQDTLKEILRKHELWLKDKDGGERADLSDAYLRGADLSDTDLSGANLRSANLSDASLSGANLRSANLRSANLRSANLSGANLRSANLSDASLSGANLRSANLRSANLRSANLSGADLGSANLSDADLSGANLRSANLSDTDLSGANLRSANLSGADLGSANLSDADLSGANLSGATGLMQQWEFIRDNFESTADGIIAYKTFDSMYKSPEKWKIEKGSVITENVNFDRTNDCCCGINVAPLKWVKIHCKGQIWKVLIHWKWLAGVCVPYNSDGKIRCECAELLCIVGDDKEKTNEKRT